MGVGSKLPAVPSLAVRRIDLFRQLSSTERASVIYGSLQLRNLGAPMTDDGSKTQIRFRVAAPVDAELLGRLNSQLIRDEGHRNPMSVSELVERMRAWLEGGYAAVIAEELGSTIGYALFRREPDHVYLRQLFVQREARRRGIGRSIVQWLIENGGQEVARLRIEVLVGNEAAKSFWKSIGFHEYCVTMELDFPRRPSNL